MDIGNAKYVSFTSYKRDGGAVPAAVWIAALSDGRVGFTTDAGSFKVKRIGRNPAVTLRPCDARGKVSEGAPEIHGTAVVADAGPDHDATVAALGKKYGLQFTLVELGGKLKRMVSRSSSPITAIVVTLTP